MFCRVCLLTVPHYYRNHSTPLLPYTFKPWTKRNLCSLSLRGRFRNHVPYLHAPVIRARRQHPRRGGVPRHAVHVVFVRLGHRADFAEAAGFFFSSSVSSSGVEDPNTRKLLSPPPAAISPERFPQESDSTGRSWPDRKEHSACNAKPGAPAALVTQERKVSHRNDCFARSFREQKRKERDVKNTHNVAGEDPTRPQVSDASVAILPAGAAKPTVRFRWQLC
jgi:hypothetical protein